MNALMRTIAVTVAFNLFVPGPAFTRNVSESEPPDAGMIDAREAEIAKREADIAAQEARRQAEVVKKQAQAVQKQMDIAMAKSKSISQPVAPTLPVSAWATSSKNRWPFLSGDTALVLVIPSAEIETKDLLTINEDMNVMSRIFETNLEQTGIPSSGAGILRDINRANPLQIVLSGRGSSSIQSLYLQGYGALFLMKVDFPLSPGLEEQQQDEPEKEQEGDKVWQETRRRLYEPEAFTKRKKDDSVPKYDAVKVQSLKNMVVDALKHASNIRNMKPDESVIVTITGSSGGSGNIFATATSNGKVVIHDEDRRITRVVDDPEPGDLGLTAPVVLVIRAKKGDIDSFAMGDLDLEQFRQRVKMLSYPYLERGSLRADIFDDYMRR